ncbi:hypothetical protein AUEXF2481DRAFT_36891 [Aureobasidium subglaciale EXF-2481]|uniref:Uncharacterized protein n=1 Tax=Aureobasidium subglaciale (strain EXF-2481) TaxID=1043005 RepID=A0A074YL14_AURSE|nr:uncharacterized protein AUEXF2481DRAFT_36891 [Aureobasidium subglaciale EXF-2481]KEQ98380.1 hypothetical protein AUEXF2481DRAFT_36891 [Aureobasidium subglaciale EXF-2481]
MNLAKRYQIVASPPYRWRRLSSIDHDTLINLGFDADRYNIKERACLVSTDQGEVTIQETVREFVPLMTYHPWMGEDAFLHAQRVPSSNAI